VRFDDAGVPLATDTHEDSLEIAHGAGVLLLRVPEHAAAVETIGAEGDHVCPSPMLLYPPCADPGEERDES